MGSRDGPGADARPTGHVQRLPGDYRCFSRPGPNRAIRGPDRESNSARRETGTPAAIGHCGQWRDPDSNRGHHDFSVVRVVRLRMAESLEMRFRPAHRAYQMFAVRIFVAVCGNSGRLRPISTRAVRAKSGAELELAWTRSVSTIVLPTRRARGRRRRRRLRVVQRDTHPAPMGRVSEVLYRRVKPNLTGQHPDIRDSHIRKHEPAAAVAYAQTIASVDHRATVRHDKCRNPSASNSGGNGQMADLFEVREQYHRALETDILGDPDPVVVDA